MDTVTEEYAQRSMHRGVCTEEYAQWCPSMDGHGMVAATVTSVDTVTEGYAQWCPSMDGQWMVIAMVE